MRLAVLLRASLVSLFVVSPALASGCGGSSSSNVSGDDGGGSSGSGSGSGSSSGSGSGGDASKGDAAGSGSSSGGGSGGGPVTCSKASTGYVMNGGGYCGSYRWAVKTGTDDDVNKVNMTPKPTTVQQLTSIPTPTVSNCNREANELQLWELKDVQVEFEHEEQDNDYHLIAFDTTGHTMVTEVPFPGCVGHNPEHCSTSNGTPWLCEITHARASVDAKVPQGTSSQGEGLATIVGPAFWDIYELQGSTHPAGMAKNGIEIHPILAICFGKGCDPLAGY